MNLYLDNSNLPTLDPNIAAQKLRQTARMALMQSKWCVGTTLINTCI